MEFPPVADPAFDSLRALTDRRPRLCGYYLLGLVAVPPPPEDAAERDEFLSDLFEQFDDQPWPPRDDPCWVNDQTWDDYECSVVAARTHLLEALIGGPEIGHTVLSMTPAEAAEAWDLFQAAVPGAKCYYTGMGLGDPLYVYRPGVVAVGRGRAGFFGIVEGD